MTLIRTCWVVFIVMTAASLYALRFVPEGMQLPIHWNIYGEADSMWRADYVLMLFPAMILGIILLFSLLKYIEPRKDNLQKSETARRWIMFVLVALFAVMGGANIALVAGYEINILRYVLIGIMLIFIVIGNFLPKIRSNFFMGIRTPWTLASDENWKKTHYFGGRIFMIFGVIGLLAVLLIPNQDMFGVWLFAPLLCVAIAPIFYSWYIWKQGKNITD